MTQNTVGINFRVEGESLNFFQGGKDGCSDIMLVVFDSKVMCKAQHSSPMTIPSDFNLFGSIKKFLCVKKFDNELKRAVRRWLFSQPTEFFRTGIFKLIHRRDKCLNIHGSYVEK